MGEEARGEVAAAGAPVPFRDALRFWVRLGFVNFGGPTGQIAIMHHELVDRRRWIDEDRYLHALNYAMLLPGPEAHQLAIYVGWLLNGTAGGLVAGIFFVLPAFFLMLALSWLYAVHGEVAWVAAVFEGLSWAVVGIVAAALARIAGRALHGLLPAAIATAAFTGIFVFGVPFPFVILGAGLLGLVAGGRVEGLDPPAALRGPDPARGDATWRRAVRVLAIGLGVWWGPILAVVALRGGQDVLAREGLFFSQVAVVTFGGAYAVLAYINQAAVERFGWLTAGEMAVGLSLAETTPGPLILVVQFVGFLAAYRSPGDLDPVVAGTLGSLVTVWAVFVPSFLWIFLGAPFVERLRGSRRLSSALSAITAAVVGVILHLALVFALNVLFSDVRTVRPLGHDLPAPLLGSIEPVALGVAAAAFFAIRRFGANVVWVILGSGLAGWLWSLVR